MYFFGHSGIELKLDNNFYNKLQCGLIFSQLLLHVFDLWQAVNDEFRFKKELDGHNSKPSMLGPLSR
jgi:hypothetical protein